MDILSINLRAITQATEDKVKVRAALKFVADSDRLDESNISGHFGNKMTLMVAGIERKSEIKVFLLRINEAGILKTLAEEVEQRIDDECVFHFRLDKQNAYMEKLKLAEGKDVIDCRMKIAAYPAKKKNAVRTAQRIFADILEVWDKS